MCAATRWARRSLSPTMSAGPWPRIGGDVPRRRSNPAKATKGTVRGQSAKPPAKAVRKQPARKAPVESLRARKQRSAGSSLPNFIPFATCLLVDRPPGGPDWVHEIKLDGWRIQVRVEDGTATLRTRNGHDYSR